MSFDFQNVTKGRRYRVRASAGSAVTTERSAASPKIHQLPYDTIVVIAEVPIDVASDGRVRIGSPAGWMICSDLELAPEVSPPGLDFAVFEKNHNALAPGDYYGLDFPFTIAMLREHGADFLTAAFRAAGTISATNAVTEVMVDPLSVKGASENAFLTVAYAEPQTGLSSRLFVKFPPEDLHHKFAMSAMSQSEVEMLRFSRSRIMPVTLAKYYYGDYSSQSTNFILITERIDFNVAPIEPAYTKGRDQDVPYVREHYHTLTEALAKLVAAHKRGALGYEVERIFPFAAAGQNLAPLDRTIEQVDRLIEFVGHKAPHLFVAEARNIDFLKKWREDLIFGMAHKDSMISYINSDIDYTGLCHLNLNIDNAWYWRDAAGVLQAGLLDWGGVGQMSIAHALCGMLMMPDPSSYLSLREEVIATFVAACAREGGPRLDVDKLSRQFKAAIFPMAISTILTAVVDHLHWMPTEYFEPMQDIFDDGLQASGLSSAIIWIDNMLREWLEDVTPGDVCRQIMAEYEVKI